MAKNFYVEKENSGENNADAKYKRKDIFVILSKNLASE